MWNMKVTIIPIVIGTHGSVTEELIKRQVDMEINGPMETIQITP